MSVTNPSKKIKDHTAEFIIRIGNGFICDSVRMDKMACPMSFLGENSIASWIVDQCQKHLPKDENVCYKNFKIKIIIDVEPFEDQIEKLKKSQEELWDACYKKKIKMNRPTHGYMKDGKYIEYKQK